MSAASWQYRCNAAPASRTISRPYLLTYKDGSRKHISRDERDSLLLLRQARLTAPKRYIFIGQPKTFNSFIDLGQWFTIQSLNPEQIRRYLANLAVMYDLAGEQELQLEETPEAFGLRLEQMGCEPTGALNA